MKATTTTTRNTEAMTDTARNIYEAFSQYETDVQAVLANLYRTTPAPLLYDLLTARRADETARANPATSERITEADEAHAEAKAIAEECARILHRISTDNKTRRETARIYGASVTRRDEARAQSRDLAKVIERTLSDRADLVQVCAIADLEPINPQEYATALERAGDRHPHIWNISITEVMREAQKRHRRNSVAYYIRAQKATSALDGMTTRTKPATDADVQEWTEAGRTIGTNYPAKFGKIAIIHQTEPTKTRPAGYYWRKQYITINQWRTLDDYTEAGEMTRTRNQYTPDLDALERIEALASRANLTHRERLFLEAFASPTARRAGAEGRRDYHTEAGAKATEAGAGQAEYIARKLWAFHRIGIFTDTAQRQMFSRMNAKLKEASKAQDIECTCMTPAEFEERNTRYYARLMTDTRRGTHTNTDPRPDLIQAIAKANEGRKAPAQAIKWTESEHTPAPTSGKDYRAEEIERRAQDNERRAQEASARGTERATARMNADKAREAHRRAWEARPRYPLTAEQWNAIPAGQRIAFIEQIEKDGYRL